MFLFALSKVLPILLLIGLGAALRRLRFLQPETIQDFKRLIVNITLPAALFLAFSQVTIEPRYLVIVVSVFTACTLVLFAGRRLGAAVGLGSAYFPSLITGFEAGMLGYAIYGAVYGAENLYKFGIVDLGQVLFVFFILVPGLQRMVTGAQPLRSTLVSFAKTPVILAIVGGLLFRQVGLAAFFESRPLLDSLLATLSIVGSLTTPLVTLVIGYELVFRPGAMHKPVITAGVRLVIWVSAGLLFAWLVVGRILHLDTAFQAAVLTLVLLPGPFVIPMFMGDPSGADGAVDEGIEANYVVNTLTLGTIITLFAYALVPMIFPPTG
jgi:predicted permease